MADDRLGYLDAFGVPVRVKGQPYVGILEDDYEAVELGRVKVESNAPTLLFQKPDVADMALARGDTISVWDTETSSWLNYQATSIQPRTDGFTLVRMIEA